MLLRPLNSRQNYPASKITPRHRINGKPPTSTEYKVMAVHNFVDWRLRVGGLVENPVILDLAALRSLAEPETQRVMHNCVQGWTSIESGPEFTCASWSIWCGRCRRRVTSAF